MLALSCLTPYNDFYVHDRIHPPCPYALAPWQAPSADSQAGFGQTLFYLDS